MVTVEIDQVKLERSATIDRPTKRVWQPVAADTWLSYGRDMTEPSAQNPDPEVVKAAYARGEAAAAGLSVEERASSISKSLQSIGVEVSEEHLRAQLRADM